MFFIVINETNKHKAKIYNHCMYTHIIIKNSSIKNKKLFALLGIRMINLSLDELRLIAQIRNMSNYENKSKEDLIKALSEAKPEVKPKLERKPKPETKPKQTPKPETKPKQTPKQTWKPETIPKQTPKPEQEPKIEIKVNKKKFKKLRKDFDKLRHKFSNKN